MSPEYLSVTSSHRHLACWPVPTVKLPNKTNIAQPTSRATTPGTDESLGGMSRTRSRSDLSVVREGREGNIRVLVLREGLIMDEDQSALH